MRDFGSRPGTRGSLRSEYMNLNRKRILLIVDGSEQSFQMAAYASALFPPNGTEVVLFHVMDKVPDAFWDWEKDPLIPQHVEYMKDWEGQKEKKIEQFMERARNVFLDAGFPPEAVIVRIRKKDESIVKDILNEARTGYTMVLMGRKGQSTIDDHMLGNIATKLLSKLSDIPICLVGEKPKAGKILIGLDSSEGAGRAAELVGKVLSSCELSLSLLYLVREPQHGDQEILGREHTMKLLEEAQEVIKPSFDSATKALICCGINQEKISTHVKTGVSSRAASLLEEARQGGFGTIVVGRRGLTEEFEMGRVASKLVQIAKDKVIWII
jgi:nucleotide-binding universal stress UspA family protein